MNEDILTSYIDRIETKVIETEESFIFETIKPYLSGVTKYVFNKKILCDALEEYFENHPEAKKPVEDPCDNDCEHKECRNMTREEAIERLKTDIYKYADFKENPNEDEFWMAFDIAIKALENEPKWIPIKTRPLTREEKEEYADLGYSEDSISFMYDCPLPEDGEEVLITTRYDEVHTDTFYCDEGCYFETYCDEDDVKAWMPLPSPYKAESEE